MAKRTEGAIKFDGISFRLNERERRILTKKAEELGETPSKTAKLLALEGKIKVMFKDKTAKEIITSLSRIGSNINQVAKKLNTDNVVDDSVKSKFDKIQGDLDIIMDFFILGKKPKKKSEKSAQEETSETLPQEIDIFSSSPETSPENKKCCNYCGAELIKTEDANTHKPLWMCAEYYKIVKNQDLLNTTSTEELKKHTVIEAV